MNAKVPLAKMELHAKTMLTLIHVPVDLASLASTVKITSLTALKGKIACCTLFAIIITLLDLT